LIRHHVVFVEERIDGLVDGGTPVRARHMPVPTSSRPK
jgi:hypothetical protein